METINHPQHYQTDAGIEAIDVMERYGLGPHLFIAMKHLLRAGKKGDRLEDLRKAQWYMRRVDAKTLFTHEPMHCYADHWLPPRSVAEVFGLEAHHQRTVVCVLLAALGGTHEDRREMMLSASIALGKAISEAEAQRSGPCGCEMHQTCPRCKPDKKREARHG